MLTRLALGSLRFYKRHLSPRLPAGMCRYQPSCASYAIVAYERFGFVRGSWLTVRRLARCAPWGGWGHDPVPERQGPSHPGS